MKLSVGRVLLISGVVLIVLGAVIALELERRVGAGLQAALAQIFYSTDIRTWQLTAGGLFTAGLLFCLVGSCTTHWRLVRR